MTKKNLWITNANSLDDETVVLPLDPDMIISFSCNCCAPSAGCYFRLQSVSFTFWVSYAAGSVSSVQEDASGGSVTYDVYSSDGTAIASNITQTLQWGYWTVASDYSYVERELFLQGTSEGNNTEGEARCWLRYYIPDTGLSSYSPSLSDFDLTNQLSGTTTTSLGLTPFIYYGTNSVDYETTFYYPLCETDATPCYAVFMGNSSQIEYTYNSTSSRYVPSVVSQGLSLYKARYSDGTYSNMWGLQSGALNGAGNVLTVENHYNGFAIETKVPFNSYTSSLYVVFYPASEITSAIRGSLIDLVEDGTLLYSILPIYDDNSVGTAFFRDSDGNFACSDGFDITAKSLTCRWNFYFNRSYNSYDYWSLTCGFYEDNTSRLQISWTKPLELNADWNLEAFPSDDHNYLYVRYTGATTVSFQRNSKTYTLKNMFLVLTTSDSFDRSYTGVNPPLYYRVYNTVSSCRFLFEEE